MKLRKNGNVFERGQPRCQKMIWRHLIKAEQYLFQTQRNRKGKQNMMKKLMGLKLKEERYNNR